MHRENRIVYITSSWDKSLKNELIKGKRDGENLPEEELTRKKNKSNWGDV